MTFYFTYLLAQIWTQVHAYQTNHYAHPYDPDLRVLLRTLTVMDQDALYARSLVVEPQPPLSPRGRAGPSP